MSIISAETYDFFPNIFVNLREKTTITTHKPTVEPKKSKRADLERSRLTGFLLGLAVSLSLFITVLNYNSEGSPSADTTPLPDHLVKDLSIPAVDEQDQSATHPTTSRKNEILSPRKTDRPEQPIESTEEVMPEARATDEAQAGTGTEQLTAVAIAQQTETATETPQQETPAAPPAPLDPVEDATETATNLPVPPGGWAAFNQWMGQTLQYPKEAQRKKIQGEVVLSFIVNADGSISDLQIARTAHQLLNKEVLRVAALMGEWKPGYKNHHPCRTYMELPIQFKL